MDKRYIVLVTLTLLLVGLIGTIPLNRVEAQANSIVVNSVADITCDGASHPLQSSTTTARWIEVIAKSSNNAAVRIGGSNVSATIGLPVAAAGGLMLPSVAVDTREATSQHFYNLATVYYFCSSSDQFSLEWAR